MACQVKGRSVGNIRVVGKKLRVTGQVADKGSIINKPVIAIVPCDTEKVLSVFQEVMALRLMSTILSMLDICLIRKWP